MKIVGYITSDRLNNGFIPHDMQNLTIRNFVSANGADFMLSWTEYKNYSTLALRSLLSETSYQGICFFSTEQLHHLDNASTMIEDLLQKNIWIGFAREKMSFKDSSEFILFRNFFLMQKYNTKNLKAEEWLENYQKIL